MSQCFLIFETFNGTIFQCNILSSLHSTIIKNSPKNQYRYFFNNFQCCRCRSTVFSKKNRKQSVNSVTRCICINDFVNFIKLNKRRASDQFDSNQKYDSPFVPLYKKRLMIITFSYGKDVNCKLFQMKSND